MKLHVVSHLVLASPELCISAIANTAFFGLLTAGDLDA